MPDPGLIRSEPFRLFFPIGIVLGFVGVSHWGWYYSGLTETYSCTYHGLLQIQGFEMAFVTGFSMTALPRFLEAPIVSRWELAFTLLTVLATSAGLYFEDWVLAQWAAGLHACVLLWFVASRYFSRQDDPPPPFVLIPFGLLFALSGAILILHPLDGFLKLGHRLVAQGVLLCFLFAFGPYLGRRLIHGVPADKIEQTVPRPAPHVPVLVGVGLLVSFLVEAGWTEPGGRLVRAVLITAYGLVGLRLHRFPARSGYAAWTLWLGFWCLIAGQWLSGLFPDYEIVALHLTFIGGFSTITLVVSIRVVAAHCGPESLWDGKARALKSIVLFLLAALLSRAASDFITWYYFGMLHVAAGFWMVASLIWGFACIPKLGRREED